MNFFEKYAPLILSVICTFIIYKFENYVSNFSTLIPLIATSSLTIAGTLLGFLLTILTIISTINTRRMQFVKDAGKYPELIGFLNKSIIANIGVILFCFFLLFIKREELNPTTLKVFDYIFIFITLFNIFLTTRFAIIFIQLLTDKKKDNTTTLDAGTL